MNFNTDFVETIIRTFGNIFTFEIDSGGSPFIKFPAKSQDFGDVKIYQNSLDEYMVVVGRFDYDYYGEQEIIRFLGDLFADKIICYENGRGCWFHADDKNGFDDWVRLSKKRNRSNKPSELFVWSGKY